MSLLILTALLLLFGETLVLAQVNELCAEQNGEQFFLQAFSDQKSFFDARISCNDLDGALLFVDNQQDFDLIADFATESFSGVDDQFYIGLFDEFSELLNQNPFRFNFVDIQQFDKSFFTTAGAFPWAANEPALNGGDPRCVIWSVDVNRWTVESCNRANSFICRSSACPQPTISPTDSPTAGPTSSPTPTPTKNPTLTPTFEPTKSPSYSPTLVPSFAPTTPAPVIANAVEVNISVTLIASVASGVIGVLVTGFVLFVYFRRRIDKEINDLKTPVATPVVAPPDFNDFKDSSYGEGKFEFTKKNPKLRKTQLDFEF